MNRPRISQAAALASLLILTLTSFGGAAASLSIRFEEMDRYVSLPFELRVAEAGSLSEAFRVAIPAIVGGAFDVEISDLDVAASYRIDFYVDRNGNGRYDRPPLDAAWRIEVDALADAESIVFAVHDEMLDIDWPPQIDGRIGEDEYRNRLVDPATGMRVHWQNDDVVLYVGLVSPGTGWLSIGFGPQRMMQGANIVIAAIAGQAFTIEDHYGNAPTSHRRDDVDHILQAGGSEAEGRSIVEFAIPLNSNDPQDVALQPGSEVTIILAYHGADDRLTAIHSARSTTSIRLDE